MDKGHIIVVSAPSGSGKTTLCRRLLKVRKNLVISVSLTTRKLRSGEKNKRDYIFATKKEFEKHLNSGGLLEWARVFGHYYGTPKKFVEESVKKGKDVLLIIDVQGGLKVKKVIPGAVLIFIMPPSLEELRRRLEKRCTDHPKQIQMRLKVAGREIARAKKYDYIVVNDNLDKAYSRLNEILNLPR